MELPTYDPAIAANVLSGVAFLVALASYRLSRKTALAAEEARQPDVQSEIMDEAQPPGWFGVKIRAKNNMTTHIELAQVRLLWPIGAVAIAEGEAYSDDRDVYGNPELLKAYPTEIARRVVDLGVDIFPDGTKGSYPNAISDTVYVVIYVRADRSWLANDLRFSVSFAARKTDMRRFKRMVSRQRIAVPVRHTA